MDVWQRIEVNPQICHGKPVIRGTRIMVRNILSMISGGYDIPRVLEAYPELTHDDVVAAVQYATDLVDEVKVIPA